MGSLKDYRAKFSTEEKQMYVVQTKALLAYQEEESSEEALKTIPLLTREDMKKEAPAYVNEVFYAGDTTVLFHDIFTNGMGYLNLMFDLKQVPERLFP